MILFFRPRDEPASVIFDAFMIESEKRHGKSVDEWKKKEEEAVWRASKEWAEARRYTYPTLEDVRREVSIAQGHIDFASKWAYGVSRLIGKGDNSE